MRIFVFLWLGLSLSVIAVAAPDSHDRVYTADQNSNTVSVIDPSSNQLLGQIRLGNPRPDILSPLYRGEVNVHGLGFSPDHSTLVVVSTVTNSVTFIDTNSNTIKGVAYIGRNPHEAFFTPDGTEVWSTVRGEDYLSVIDPITYREIDRIPTTPGPGMTIFSKDGHLAFVCNSFHPVVDVFNVKRHEKVKSISVVSPFSPFIQVTPNGDEVWLTHKDVGKVTRIDTDSLSVIEVIDTGAITNHLGFGVSRGKNRAYVTVGGENKVKVFSTDTPARLIKIIDVGALPHGVWGSADGSRIFVGLENGDAVNVIDTSVNEVIANIPIGEAPQALVYVPNAVKDGDGTAILSPRPDRDATVSLSLAATGGPAKGHIVARNRGLVDILDIGLSGLNPDKEYELYMHDLSTPVAMLQTDASGAASVTAVSPTRQIRSSVDTTEESVKAIVVEAGTAPSMNNAVLAGRQ